MSMRMPFSQSTRVLLRAVAAAALLFVVPTTLPCANGFALRPLTAVTRHPTLGRHPSTSLRVVQESSNAADSDTTSAADTDTTADTTDNTLDTLLEETKLRQAVSYLQQHPETVLTRSRWNSIFEAIEVRTAEAEENDYQATGSAAGGTTEFPLESAARLEMTHMYQTLAQQHHLQLFGALDPSQPLAAGSHTLSPALLEEILELPMVALTPQPTNTLLLAGGVVAVLEIVASIVSGVSLDVWLLGTLVASLLDRIVLNGAALESLVKVFSPGVQQKILRHEAGHFLAAYLLGCPVEGLVLSAWAALADKRFGNRQVSAGTSFFDPELSQQINRSGQVTRSAIDRYSIIVMAGIAAEAETYGRADGGAGDEMALVAFLSQLNGNNNANAKSQVWNSQAIRNQARWGALQAVLLLRTYKPAYEALVDCLERGGRLGDCIHAVEEAARIHQLPRQAEPLGYIGPGGAEWKLATESTAESTAGVASQSNDARNDKEELPTMQTLQEYRAQVEQRLQDIDRQLKEIKE